jgi:hypothetical protein
MARLYTHIYPYVTPPRPFTRPRLRTRSLATPEPIHQAPRTSVCAVPPAVATLHPAQIQTRVQCVCQDYDDASFHPPGACTLAALTIYLRAHEGLVGRVMERKRERI